MRVRRQVSLALAAVLVGTGALALSTGPAAAQRYTAGAAGAGDPYFPFAGNGGYDVKHYDLDLTYTPPAAAPAPLVGQLSGVATIDLVATQDLDRFNLDLRGMDVQAITVNGKPAREVAPPAAGAEVDGAAYWQVQDDAARIWELTIQPRPKIKRGQTARVVVTYGGATTRPVDIEGALYGWVTTRDGAMVVGEPEGSMTWYPVSDHPTDKATYGFEITRARGQGRGRQRAACGRPRHRGRVDDLVLGRPRPAGQLSDHGLGRRLRPAPLGDAQRAADHRRGRRRPHGRQRGDHRGEPRTAGGDDRLLRGHVRAIPVQLLRLDRRRRHRRATRSRRRPGRCTRAWHGRARSPTSWRTSGSATR